MMHIASTLKVKHMQLYHFNDGERPYAASTMLVDDFGDLRQVHYGQDPTPSRIAFDTQVSTPFAFDHPAGYGYQEGE